MQHTHIHTDKAAGADRMLGEGVWVEGIPAESFSVRTHLTSLETTRTHVEFTRTQWNSFKTPQNSIQCTSTHQKSFQTHWNSFRTK